MGGMMATEYTGEVITTAKPYTGDVIPMSSDKESTWYENLARQPGLTARAALGGLASTLDLPNFILSSAAQGVNGLTGMNLPVVNPSPMRQSYDNMFNAAGIAPRNATERVVERAVGGLSGATGSASLAGQIAKTAASPVARGVASQMAAAPVAQAIGGTSGGAAGQTAAELGADPWLQTLASLTGSVAPSAAPAIAGKVARQVMRGGDSNIPEIAARSQAFADAGAMTPSAGQATGSRIAQAADSVLSKIPGSAGPMAAAAERQAAEIGEKVTQLADSLSKIGTPANAGRAIEQGISGIPGKDGFIQKFKTAQSVLYNKLDQFLPQNAEVDISNTKKILASMNADIDGAPALSKWFKNAKIQGIEKALESDTKGTNAGVMVVPPNATTAEARAAASHGALKPLSVLMREGQSSEPGNVSQIRNPYTGEMKDAISGSGARPTILSSESTGAPATYKNGDVVGIPGGSASNELPYEAIKKLRTLVGAELENNSLVSDVPRSKWKALYSALSQDLDKAAVGTGNPEAIKAMKRANAFTKAGYDRIETVLDKVIGKDKVPENIFKTATSSADMEAGATKIASVMKSLEPSERDIVKSAFIRRMGLATKGAQNADGDIFSSNTFLTNWNKISPQAKDVMFQSEGNTVRKSLDQIAKALQYIKEGSKVFSNPSGTTPAAALVGGVGSVATAVGTGHLKTAALLLSGMGVANLSAKLMTNPGFVKWLAKSSDIPPAALPLAINELRKSSQDQTDDVRHDIEKYINGLPTQKQIRLDTLSNLVSEAGK